MTEKTESKEELRKRLREKIKSKRGGTSSMSDMSNQMKKDPQTALMSLGVEDMTILKNAKSIVKNPSNFLKQNLENDNNKTILEKKESHDSDDEEMPPEAL